MLEVDPFDPKVSFEPSLMAVVHHLDLRSKQVTNIGSNEYAKEYFGDCVEGLSLKQDVNRSHNGPPGSHH